MLRLNTSPLQLASRLLPRKTPLLLNRREFLRAVRKERSRCDRSDQEFGLVVIQIDKTSRRKLARAAKALHRRLRDTDEKGLLSSERVGVLLPLTGPDGTAFVTREMIDLLRAQGIDAHGSWHSYPDQDNDDTGGRGEFADSERDWDSALEEESCASEDSKPETLPVPATMMADSYPAWKRCSDIIFSGTGLLLGLPIMVVVALLIKLTDRGPILFCQQRTGYLGRDFTIYKFRSMVNNAEELKCDLQALNERDGPAFKMRRDPRITPVGRFLRATGLDELPQLYNVLVGDMAMVGPRPLPVEEAALCSPWQRRREHVKPGLTCFWQLAKDRQVTFIEWMRMDLQYARRTSPWLDARLLIQTVKSVVLGRVGH